MTTVPPSPAQGEPAGVSEVTPALLRNCAVCLENGMTPNTVAKELRAYADILARSDIAARQQLAELVNEVAGHHFVRNERDRLLEQLRAQGLSQEDRAACLAGATALIGSGQSRPDYFEDPIAARNERHAAILRRLGGQLCTSQK